MITAIVGLIALVAAAVIGYIVYRNRERTA